MKINAHEAKIKTASVEVKTLSISGKQVTLAVFRQLDEVNVVDLETVSLRGVCWERVNYHPDKCGGDGEHLHIVWQLGSSIYRSAAPKTPDFGFIFPAVERIYNEIEKLLPFYIVANYLFNSNFKYKWSYQRPTKHGDAVSYHDYEFGGHRYTVKFPNNSSFIRMIASLASGQCYPDEVRNENEWAQQRKANYQNPNDEYQLNERANIESTAQRQLVGLAERKEVLSAFLKPVAHKELHEINTRMAELAAQAGNTSSQLNLKYKQLYETLAQLDLLFIAV